MSWFAVDVDASGDQTIWLVQGDHDPKPMPVFSKSDLAPNMRHLWPTIARALLEAEVPA